jgi:pimeloyl-ACP methyl ester carboxylesterase
MSRVTAPDHVALVGHSLGGCTVLGLAGGWPSRKRGDIKAVVARAHFAGPLLLDGSIGGVTAPVLIQGGREDKVVEPAFHDDTAAATVAFLATAFAGDAPTEADLQMRGAHLGQPPAARSAASCARSSAISRRSASISTRS